MSTLHSGLKYRNLNFFMERATPALKIENFNFSLGPRKSKFQLFLQTGLNRNRTFQSFPRTVRPFVLKIENFNFSLGP